MKKTIPVVNVEMVQALWLWNTDTGQDPWGTPQCKSNTSQYEQLIWTLSFVLVMDVLIQEKTVLVVLKIEHYNIDGSKF